LATTTARAAETDPAATAPAPAPDIQIAMTSSRQQVTAGETFTTTVTATNVGDGTANDVALHIALPVDTEFVSGRAALVDGARRTAALRRPTADDSWPCHVSSRVVTCPVGEMTPSAKYVVELNLRALQTGVLVVQADTTASNATSRRAQVKVKANPAHVELVARLQTSERGGNVQLDERYTATVVVANTGGTSAREVAVSLDVPAGSSYVGASADGAQCRVADGTLVCTVARLAPGASRRIEVRLHANARGKVRLAVSGRSANQAHIGSRFVILPAVPQTVGFTAVVYFSSGSAFLSARARRELDLTAHEVATGRLSRATLSCNTDDVGSLTYNFALSRARCQAVAGYLARTGQLRRIRYAEHAWAYLRPAASNASSAGRARNRRVEIRID
jgi:uncharacterized repeat protein (TIGR01451 family)